MINRTHRFHGHNSLRYVYRNGKQARAPQIALKYALNEQRNTYRCAVVVSKRVHKSAAARNRIRRRIYEIVRLQDSGIGRPFDMVFTVFDEKVVDAPPPELQNIISSLLRQAGIRTGPK
jgi:ribonuclease P protein component